ncbi:dTMP kinase [Sphingobium sp. SCG-1]|uniref:dTMP kinase n=1 Tax=Sphingobium sp. SCG-1 TaxID=2072936 RepID=UPI000CD680AD|nr:dTMP kinase [Sphingobium sp. SCG-1]AUW58586.1 dTMP kinase [Sphingobium sp. SCG-1]
MQPGRFVSLEGGEGAGKSTQVKALAQALRNRGVVVVETREPGGSAGAEAIRDLLLKGDADRWTPRAEALLFAAARSDHVSRVIRPAIGRGEWVIADRFLDSSRAYQGGSNGLVDEDILSLHRIGSEGFLPDRTLILAVSEDVAEARASARDTDGPDRIGGRSQEYHRLVANSFKRFAGQEPERFRVVDASGSADAVTANLLEALADMLP